MYSSFFNLSLHQSFWTAVSLSKVYPPLIHAYLFQSFGNLTSSLLRNPIESVLILKIEMERNNVFVFIYYHSFPFKTLYF